MATTGAATAQRIGKQDAFLMKVLSGGTCVEGKLTCEASPVFSSEHRLRFTVEYRASRLSSRLGYANEPVWWVFQPLRRAFRRISHFSIAPNRFWGALLRTFGLKGANANAILLHAAH
jgi:hypothetical protein